MEVETKIMSMLDIFIILGLILSPIVSILTIIASFMKIKWKALFPKFRLKAKLKKYIKDMLTIQETQTTHGWKPLAVIFISGRKRHK